MQSPPHRLGLALLTCLALLTAACQTTSTNPGGAAAAAHEQQHRRAIDEIQQAAANPDPQLRMRAIEATQHLHAHAPTLVAQAVQDPHPAVRYAAWVTAGRLRVTELEAPARAAAQNADETDFVRAAAAFAAAQMIRPADPDAPPPVVPAGVDLGPLAGLLWSERAGMRANAAVLLGETGSPSARPMLRDAAKRPTPRAARTDQTLLELQISEALVKLGEEDQLKALRLAAYSKDDEVRVLAVLMLGRLDDQTMEGALLGFLKQDPQELRLAAAQALGHMGWPDGLPAALKGATSDLERIRAQSALALGRAMTAIPATDSVHDTQARVAAYTALDRLLSDPAASVRLSAAAAVLEPAP